MIEPGTILQDRFLIEEQIGVGGMGAVYRAVDQKFGTSVAIKETLYSDPALAQAFEREARLLNGLHHPLFPHVSDHFVEGTGHFLVMEYIDGDDLSDLLKRGERFAVDMVMQWTLDLLDGLDYLHSQDPPIIHRDVKPSNLRLTSRGNLVLLDFGMAKETTGDTQGMQSVFGYSRRYSPLEQIEGTGTDVRSDIFSLGATVYHLLTGTPPTDVLARASAIVSGKPDPLRSASEIDPNVPDLISAILHSALSLNAEKRFVSARSMWTAVEEALRAKKPLDLAKPVSQTETVAAVPKDERFPALEAFANDADLETTSAKPSVFRTVNDDHSRLNNRLLWLPALLILFGLVAFGLYRSNSDGAASEPAASVENIQPAEADPTDESLVQDTSETSDEVGSNESNSLDTAKSERPSIEDNETSDSFVDPADNDRKVKDRALDQNANGSQSTTKPVAKADVLSSGSSHSKNASSRRTTRPRIVKSDTDEPPVSSIESVITGLPDRSRQQRQWEIWRQEEEQRRQRRIRRQMRRGLPY